MDYVELGTTGRTVSAIALGCMSLGYGGEDQEAYDRRGRKAVIRAFELGITLFDTADVYGRGKSEEMLGMALREGKIPRDQVVIASKCAILFVGMSEEYAYKAYDTSAAYIKASCEASLKRMGTDYIDLYQLHRIDYLTHPEETARALEDLETEGKIRHAGISNYTVGEIRALSAYIRLESLQTQFSLLHLEPLEFDLASLCLEKKMNILCWSPLHHGMLVGNRPFAHDDWQAQREQGILTQVRDFAQEYGVTPGQLALAWLVHLPGGVIPLVGTANPDHIEEAVKATQVRLARDDWYELLVIARGRPMPFGQRPYLYLRER